MTDDGFPGRALPSVEEIAGKIQELERVEDEPSQNVEEPEVISSSDEVFELARAGFAFGASTDDTLAGESMGELKRIEETIDREKAR